jgi:hypothetical protein
MAVTRNENEDTSAENVLTAEVRKKCDYAEANFELKYSMYARRFFILHVQLERKARNSLQQLVRYLPN